MEWLIQVQQILNNTGGGSQDSGLDLWTNGQCYKTFFGVITLLSA